MPPRRKVGAIERAVRLDLRAYPDEIAKGTIAASLLAIAARLDAGMGDIAYAQCTRELRMSADTLREMAPQTTGDALDQLRQRRERRLGAG